MSRAVRSCRLPLVLLALLLLLLLAVLLPLTLVTARCLQMSPAAH
jgi:hypothetical protein